VLDSWLFLEFPMNSNSNQQLFRFGVFELDGRTGELRKSGVRVRLQQQPLQILRVLLENSGKVLTRQQICTELWPDGTYVDFDRSLNRAVVKLREALGDSAESPRFVETLPKLGYRFIAPVATSEGSRNSVTHSPSPPVVTQSRSRVFWRYVWLALLLASSLILLLTYWSTSPKLPRVQNITSLSRSPEPKLAQIVSDDLRIYFSEHDDDLVHPMQLSISGGEEVPLATSPGNWIIFDISPDRSELLVGTVTAGSVQYEGRPPLWILPLVGGAPQRVGEVRAQSATWFPDGRSVSYGVRGDLYRCDRDGGNIKKLLSVAGTVDHPRWSPDGRTLRFDVNSLGQSVSLWEANADGSNPHALLSGWNSPANECCGRWTADGSYYVFQSRQAGRTDLWAIREKWPLWRKSDRAPFRLTNGPLNFLSPFPSRDGSKLYAMGEQEIGELNRYDGKEFVPYLAGVSAEGVAFSRDRQWVAYVSYPEGVLWRGRIDGTDRLQLTQSPLLAALPQWSPDGKQIAFAGTGGTQSLWQIYVIPMQGGRPRQLTFAHENRLLPWWSPDGTSVMYSGFPGSSPELSLVDVSTLQVTTVPGSTGLCAPTWLADGRIVAVGSEPGRIVSFDPATQHWSEVWRGAFDYYNVSHDGQWVYFDTKWQNAPGIFRVRMKDHKWERVTSLRGVRRTTGLAGTWFDIAPDDSPMLLRNLNTEQVYKLDLAFK